MRFDDRFFKSQKHRTAHGFIVGGFFNIFYDVVNERRAHGRKEIFLEFPLHDCADRLSAALYRFQGDIARKSVGYGNIYISYHNVAPLDVARVIYTGHAFEELVCRLMKRVALVILGAVAEQPHLGIFHAVGGLRVSGRHDGEMREIDGFAVEIRSAVAKERARPFQIGNTGTERGTGNSLNAPQNEHRGRKHRARGSRGYQSIRSALFEELKRDDGRGIFLRLDGLRRHVVVRDYFGRMHDLHARRIVFVFGELRFQRGLVAREDYGKIPAFSERFDRALYLLFGSEIAAHGIYGNFNHSPILGVSIIQ